MLVQLSLEENSWKAASQIIQKCPTVMHVAKIPVNLNKLCNDQTTEYAKMH